MPLKSHVNQIVWEVLNVILVHDHISRTPTLRHRLNKSFQSLELSCISFPRLYMPAILGDSVTEVKLKLVWTPDLFYFQFRSAFPIASSALPVLKGMIKIKTVYCT